MNSTSQSEAALASVELNRQSTNDTERYDSRFHSLVIQLVPPKRECLMEVVGWCLFEDAQQNEIRPTVGRLLPNPLPISIMECGSSLTFRDEEMHWNRGLAKLGNEDQGEIRAVQLLLSFLESLKKSPGRARPLYLGGQKLKVTSVYQFSHYQGHRWFYIVVPDWENEDWVDYVQALTTFQNEALLTRIRGLSGRMLTGIRNDLKPPARQ